MSESDENRAEAWGPAMLRRISELDTIEALLGVLHDSTLDEMFFTRAACRRLLALPGGVDALYHAAWDFPKLKGTASVLSTFLAARRQKNVDVMIDVSHFPGLNVPVSREIAEEASRRLSDLMAESMSDPRRFFAVLHFAQMDFMAGYGEHLKTSQGEDEAEWVELATLLAEPTISLTLPLIADFEQLVHDDSQPEQSYQSFLAANPVFLDPLAAETIDRQRLGDDLITDFVIRRHDGRYLVVEIEKPRDKIFTAQNDFSAPFTHGFGQVIDFMGWLDENVAYARNKLPGIEAVDGLLVIGRRSDLSAEGAPRLRRYSQNSRRVEILTFDDLATRARHLYASIRYGRLR